MKIKRLSTLLLFNIISIFNCFSQDPCEIFCPETNEFINVCSECDVIIASDNCADALVRSICHLDGFSVTTLCNATIDGPDDLSLFCGPGSIVNNNMWIGFVPAFNGRLHLNIEIIDCLSTNTTCNGLQAAVSRALCQNPGNEFFGFEYETLDCVNCVDQTFDLITVDAISGVPHYIMIDGCCEDVCEIIVHVIDGIPEPGWTIESMTSNLIENDADPNCLSENSSITAIAEPNIDADPNASLLFTWYEGDFDKLVEDNMLFSGPPNSGNNTSILTGINPLTGDPFVCNEGVYTVFVKELTNCCEDEYGKSFMINVNSIETNREKEKFIIFPNPTTNTLNLQITDGTLNTNQIDILDSKGMIIKNYIFENSNKAIDITDLPSGIYMVQIVFKNGTVGNKKLIKI